VNKTRSGKSALCMIFRFAHFELHLAKYGFFDQSRDVRRHISKREKCTPRPPSEDAGGPVQARGQETVFRKCPLKIFESNSDRYGSHFQSRS
jgi:hypothetical protein